MTDPPTELELPRLSRQIGITGLGQTDAEGEESQPIGVLRHFAGILSGRESQRPAGEVTPSLAYLTLAPLVSRALAHARTTETHGVTPQSAAETHGVTPQSADRGRTVLDQSPSASDATETADEPTVREVLRAPDAPPTASETTDESAGDTATTRELTTVTPHTRTVRTLGAPSEPGASRTVVERSGRERAKTGTTADTSDDTDTVGSDGKLDELTVRKRLRAQPGPAPDAAGSSETPRPTGRTRTPSSTPSDGDTDRSMEATTTEHTAASDAASVPGAAHATTADVDETGATVGGTGSRQSPSMTVVNDSGGDRARHRTQFDTASTRNTGTPPVRARPRSAAAVGSGWRSELTVRQPDSTMQRPEVERGEQGEDSARGTRHRAGSAPTDEPTTPPTVIADDGSVNDRVLDRLYEELERKRRIERDREGR